MGLKRTAIERLAKDNGVSTGAIEAIALAMAHSRTAQFNHPELGGMGQWMSGGMVMIGDMLNHDLKAKVDRVCRSVAAAILASAPEEEERTETTATPSQWWPKEFGRPGSVGSQNAMRYAIFPASRRLVIDDNGAVYKRASMS